MHEFGLAEELVKLAKNEAIKAGISRLDKVVIRIGDLSGVSIDSLEFAFGFLKEENEITKEAELVVEKIEGKGRCRECEKEITLDRLFLYCPECGKPSVEVLQGREFYLASLEGEIDEDVKEKPLAEKTKGG